MENQNQRSNEETEIDLVELFWVLWRKLPLMIAVGLFTALLAFGGSKFLMTPTYQSVTKIYILNKQDSSNTNVTYSDLQAGTQLVKDYSELIKSRFVLEAVIEQLNLPLSYEQLSGKVTVSTPTDTRVISIAVTDSSPVAAMKIANAIRETASTHIRNVMDIEAVNIVETANVPTHKASPSAEKNTVLGGMLGILIVAAIVILSHLMNDTIQTEEDVEKYLGISTLAMIPLNEADSKKKKKPEGAIYNIPGKGNVSVSYQGKKYFEKDLPITQFGSTEVLVNELFNKKINTRVVFNPETGAILKIDKD